MDPGRITHLRDIRKTFGATRALDGVDLVIRSGEILALVGENGAGKTTLMRIAAGEMPADSGEIVRDGNLELVHQHFMLVPALTIAENLALAAREFRVVSKSRLEAQARETIAAAGIDLPEPGRMVSSLSVGEKSKLELIKAIARRPAVLVLDEPTSVLTPRESDELFRVLRMLSASGTAIVFITHKLPEVMAVADRIVVMRRGRVVHECLRKDTSAAELARVMVVAPDARLSDEAIPERENRESGERKYDEQPVLRLQQVRGATLDGVDMEIRRGEIVAVVGVAGNGQVELASMLRGITRPRSGRIVLDRGTAGHIPEDRTRDGIVAQMTLTENLALSRRSWHARDAELHAFRMIDLFSIRTTGPSQLAGDLSGGNQQKVVLARELDGKPALIVAAEPSRGLDLEATAFVHRQLRAAADSGAAILLITSDLEEAFALATAICVLYRGRLSPRLAPSDAASRVADLMTGAA